ncbi:MAG: EAL domain-containing protein [Halomonadaceae bacterium]|nr:MAG: EAL domain-containing protein [Halomonadaceae bacterium]
MNNKKPAPLDSASLAVPLMFRQGPSLIALGYLLLGVLWIVFSDAFVEATDLGYRVQTWKGLGYVAATAVLLYGAMQMLYRMMQQSQERLFRAQRIAGLGDWGLDRSNRALSGSPELYQLLGVAPAKLQSWDQFRALFRQQDQGRLDALLEPEGQSNVQSMLECQLAGEGHQRWFQLRVESGCSQQVAGTLLDITRQRGLMDAVLEREARFAEMARHIPEVFWIYEPEQQCITYVSPAFEKIWQYTPEELALDPALWMASVHPDDREQVRQRTAQNLTDARPCSGEYRIHRADGQWRWVHDRTYPICDEQGVLLRIVGVTQDVTEEHYHQQALYQAAHYDGLTGLPNRVLFHERLEHQCLETSHEHRSALFFIDLDRFKTINDSMGHSAGDELLRQVAQRLQEVLLGRGFIARLGGDEFAVLLSRQSDFEQHEKVARDLICALSRPYLIQQQTSYVTVSMGIALYPADGSDPETLLKNADMAMYSAKAEGRNTYTYFHHERASASTDRMHLEMDIHRAVERGEFELYYQAQFTVDDRSLVGAECLLRWHHPQRGMISPVEFIPLLEETGLIQRVGLWVIEEACRQLQAWCQWGLRDFILAVNVSARQLNDEQLPAHIAHLLEVYQVPGNMLELELTESSLMQEPAHALRLFTELRAMGVRIAIDDFGTGYSSLNYLKQFAPDLLKIDKSFVDGIAGDDKDRAILFAIINLAHTLDICVIAEGVELEEQMTSLSHGKCDWVQGFLMARPQPAGVFVPWLQQQRLLTGVN